MCYITLNNFDNYSKSSVSCYLARNFSEKHTIEQPNIKIKNKFVFCCLQAERYAVVIRVQNKVNCQENSKFPDT